MLGFGTSQLLIEVITNYEFSKTNHSFDKENTYYLNPEI